MAVTALDSALSGQTGTAGRSRAQLNTVTFKFYYYQPVGNLLAIWDVSDTSNITLEAVVDLATMSGVNALWVDQVNVTFAGIGFASTNPVMAVNYDPAGNCYLAVYAPTYNGGSTSITGLTQSAFILLGTNAPDTSINQASEVLPSPGYELTIFGDDILFISGPTSPTLILTLTVATTPGNGVGGIATNEYFSSPQIIYASGKGDGFVAAWEISGVPVATLLWSTNTAGSEARYCYRSLSTDGTQIVAVIVDNTVELFDPDDGTALGIYTNALGGTITDVILNDTCMFVFTDNTADNAQSVSILDPTNPSLSTSATLPTGTGYAITGSHRVNLGPPGKICLSSNASGEAALITIDLGECPVSVVTAAFSSCFSLGNFLLVADGGGSALKIYDLTFPTSPTLTATLDLAKVPTDVVALNSVVYLAAGDTVYAVNLDDVGNPVQVIEHPELPSEFLLNANGLLWVSGDTIGLRILSIDPGEDDLSVEQYLPAPDGGISKPAFTRDRIVFADLPESSTASLRTFKFGGVKCHNVKASHLGAYETDAEVVRSRIGDIRHLSTHALEVAGTPGAVFDGPIKIGDRWIFSCAGSPEGVITAGPGSLAMRDDGNIYRKSSGSGNTGWSTT